MGFVAAQGKAHMSRQENLELEEAIHRWTGNDGGGSDGAQGADCIADMSTRPWLTTGVTSRQTVYTRPGQHHHLQFPEALEPRICNLGAMIGSLSYRRV